MINSITKFDTDRKYQFRALIWYQGARWTPLAHGVYGLGRHAPVSSTLLEFSFSYLQYVTGKHA